MHTIGKCVNPCEFSVQEMEVRFELGHKKLCSQQRVRYKLSFYQLETTHMHTSCVVYVLLLIPKKKTTRIHGTLLRRINTHWPGSMLSALQVFFSLHFYALPWNSLFVSKQNNRRSLFFKKIFSSFFFTTRTFKQY